MKPGDILIVREFFSYIDLVASNQAHKNVYAMHEAGKLCTLVSLNDMRADCGYVIFSDYTEAAGVSLDRFKSIDDV